MVVFVTRFVRKRGDRCCCSPTLFVQIRIGLLNLHKAIAMMKVATIEVDVVGVAGVEFIMASMAMQDGEASLLNVLQVMGKLL